MGHMREYSRFKANLIFNSQKYASDWQLGLILVQVNNLLPYRLQRVHNISKQGKLSALIFTLFEDLCNSLHTFFKFLLRTYSMSVQILIRAIMKNRIPMMLYKLLKQSMVASTHIENFLKTPEHKLLEKTKTVRKLELQTFVLITLYSDRWRHHVCVLRSKAHDLLGTSLAAKGPGIVNLVIATTYSETRLLIQDGGRYEANLLGSISAFFFGLLEFLRCVFTSHQGNLIFSKAFCVCSVLIAWFSLAYFPKIPPTWEEKSVSLEQRLGNSSL